MRKPLAKFAKALHEMEEAVEAKPGIQVTSTGKTDQGKLDSTENIYGLETYQAMLWFS